MDRIKKAKKAILDHVLPQAQHGDVTIKLGERGGFNIYARKGDPLDRYRNTTKGPALTEDQYNMGVKISNWMRISRIYAPSGMNIDPMTGSGTREMTEAQVIAYHTYLKLMKEVQRVHGLPWVHALRDICAMGETLESRKELKYRERKIKCLAEVLQTAFDYWKKELHPARLNVIN